MTLDQLRQKLRQRGSSTPELDGRLLLAMVTGLTVAQILAGDWQLSPKQAKQLSELVEARAQTPIAYLRGRVEFFGIDFNVDRRALVPRPESEDLVSLALSLAPHRAVYDIGCGSGCLGLAYQLNQSQPTKLHLVDSSAEALALAQENATRLACPAEFWLKSVADLEPEVWQPQSLVLANLPYLDQDEKEAHYQHCPDLRAEPPQALFANRRGLAIYRQLWPRLGPQPSHLLIEANYSQQATLIAQGKKYGWQLLSHRGLALAFGR